MINNHNEDWNELKDKLKYKYPFLTEYDLYYAQGTKADILENLRIKLGKSKPEMLALMSML
jgi:hypothetical protein